MNKNNFLIFNDLTARLYSCCTLDQIRNDFLIPLRMLIPFSYASLFLSKPAEKTGEPLSNADLLLPDPLCVPEHFKEAELKYLDYIEEDRTLWLLRSRESTVIRESDLFSDADRLNAPLYLHCYRKYDVYDIIQLSVTFQERFLGVLSLFRTRVDGYFSEEDMFYLRSLGLHLNQAIRKVLYPQSESAVSADALLDALTDRFLLTSRERAILSLTFSFCTQEEITERLNIRATTLQKHLQNIYRKTSVSSRWELLRFLKQADKL